MSETKKASFHTLEREEYFANPPDEQKYPLLRDAVAPHIGSFNALTEGGMDSLLNLAAKEVGERVVFDGDDEVLGNRLAIRVANVQLGRPTVSARDKTTINRKVFPSECRERMATYRARMVLTLGYSVNGGPEKFESREVGMIPIMMGSNRCHLEGMGPKELVAHKEESEEQGGYFVINGLEKLIRLLIVQRRNHPLAIIRKSFVKRGNNYTTFGVQIRSVRPDQSSQTNVLHYLSDGGITMRFSWRKNEYLVPVMMILKALVETNDREIFDGIVASEGSNSFLTDRLELLLRNYKSYKLTSKQENLAFLGEKFRIVMDAPKDMSNEDVGRLMLKRVILVHLDNNTDKFRMLLFMIRKLYALVASECAPDNPDAVQHQEVLLGGFLYGMIIKERMEEYLTNFCAAVRTELQKKRQPLHLDDPKIMQRICPRINEDIGRKLHYFLSTGNLVSHTGLDLQQTTGYTVIVEKINFHRFIAHFRMIHRGSFFAELKTTDVRKLLPESWGFLCPVHTPDGSPCGLLNHLAHKCLISVKKSDVGDIDSVLNQLGISPAGALANTPQKSVVMLDGKIIGWCTHEIAQQAANTIRQWKVTGDPRLPRDLEVGLVPPSRGGQYPGLYLFAEASRFMRPVKHLATEKEDIVGPFEQVYLNVAVTPDEITNVHSHVEYSPTNILSILANMTPFSDFNQSPRNMYQCQMGKQAMGTPGVLTHRSDNKMYRLQTGQSPIVRAGLFDEYGLDNFPNGMNAVVAVISYTGYDMDDAMIINKSAHERGFGHGTIYKTEKVDLTEKQKPGDPTLLHFGFGPDNWPREWTQTLDVDGLPLVGAKLKNGDPIAAYYDSNSNKTMVLKYKSGETGFVEEVKLLGDETPGELQKITVKLRIPRSPVIGDKFSSRHGQKGVCSQKWPTYDMPFSESGIQPDVIINPHAFPSRMTIGMFVESLAAKSGALHGMAQDATPWQFSETNTAAEYFGEQLLKAGYNYHGNEPMYSGVTGQELRCDIYVGVVFYQRLRHMVNDKFQVRSTGPVNPLTMQPVKGRKRSGGIRVGEMERDALIGHGTSYLLQDRLLNCSDYTQTSMCRTCGSLTACQEAQSTTGHRRGIKCRRCATQLEKGSFSWDSPPEGMWQDSVGNCFVGGDDTTTVAIPFVLKYLNSELSAMGIKMKYNIDPTTLLRRATAGPTTRPFTRHFFVRLWIAGYRRYYTRTMDSSSQFQAEAISGGVDFSPVFLMDVIMILLVSLFVIFYFNRLIAWVTNFGLRFVFWHKHRIRVKVQSVQISLLGGRIFFKNLTYIGTNQTICFLKGHFTWRYWLWKSRKSALQMSEDSEGNVSPEKLQSRLALEVDGLEWFVYNRTPAYDAVFEQFQARHNAQTEPKCENNDTLQTAHTSTSYEPKNFSFGEQIYLDLFPIDLKVHKGSMVVGNRDTQSVWMFHFKNATGLVDVAPTPSYLDRYRQVYHAEFEHPVVEMRPNVDYKGMDSTHFEHKPKVKKSLWAKTYENEPNTSKLRRSLRAIRAVLLARALPDNESEHSREGMPWMGLSRYLTQDTEYYVEDDKNEGAFEDYARVPQILDAPSGSLTMYYDVQGQVPHIEGVGPKDSPQWGMKITAMNATINYGPSTERQRTDLHQMLIPRTCIDAVPSPSPVAGDLRPYEQFRVDVEFQEEMILRVPIREESKNLEFANLFRDDPGANTKRPFGWMEIKTNNTVTVEEIQSMEATRDGWAHTVSINLGQTEVRTSVNHGLLFTGDHVSLECDLSTPLEWNGLCDWKFDLQSSSVKLFLLDEHITLFSDLTNDFGSDTPVPYTLFTPYKYTFHWGVSHFCNIYLNINDANIINNPTDFEDNTFLVFESDALDIDFSLPLDQIHQSLNEATFKISAPIMDFNLSVPPWHTLDSFLETEKMGRAYEFAIVGTYSYYSSFDKEHTDSMHVEIYGTDVTMVAHGIFVCYLMKVIDNYFGINTKFQTMEEYAQRDAPKVIDPVNFIKEKNDMDVVVDTFITNGVIVLPANLYSTREYLRLDFPSLDIDCRFTNYYMDLQSNIAPIRGRCVTEATTKAYMLARESRAHPLGEVQPHIYIDGIDVHGHRLFGRPPEEPTYYCKWDFHLGDIQVRGPMSSLAVLGQAADCFDYGFDDTENKLLMAIPLLFDVTFVSAKINSLTFRLEADPGAVEVLTSSVAFKLNDLNNSDYTARASVKIPWIQLSVMTNEEVLSQLTTSVLVTDYIQKRNMDERRGKQQDHIRLHDDSFGRCDFLLIDKYAPDDKPYTIVPTLPLPPLAEPLTDENINSLGTAGIFSTYKKRENYDIAQSSLSSASTNSHRMSIDSSFMTRSSGISRMSRSRNSYKIRKFRRPRIESKFLAPKPWRKASKTAVSDIDVDPDFAQDFFASKMRPGMSASRETPDEDTETDNIVVQLGKIGGTLTPAALTVILAIMAQTPQDGFHVTLDKLQIQVMKKLNYILSGQPETKNIRVVIPGVDIEMKASPGGSEEYVHLQMGTIDIMVRDNVHKRPQSIEDFIQETMDGHEPRENSLIVYGSMDLTLEVVKSSHTIGPSPNPLVLGLTQFEFWLNQDVCNSASAQIKELDVSLDNQQLEWLLRNTDRQLDRLKLLLDDIPNQNKATQSDRTKDVVYSLALAGQQFDITSDPSTLTKPAYIIRLSQQHVRAHDSWKILIRLRHILQTVPASWYSQKEKQLIHGDCKVPVDARTKVINVFKKWRFWEINSIPKSYLFLHVFPPEGKKHMTMTTRVLVDVDGIGLRLLFAECENYLLFDYVQVYVDVSEGDDHVIDADAGVCVASIRTHFSLEIVDTIQTIARYVDATKPSDDEIIDTDDTTRPNTNGEVAKLEPPLSPMSMSTSMLSDKSTTPEKSVSPVPEKPASKSPPIRVMVNTLLSSWVVSIKSSAITLSVSGQEFLNSVFVEKTGDDLVNDVSVILTGTFGSTGVELIATETDQQVVSYSINSTATSIAFGKSIHVTCDTQNMLLTVSQDLLALVKLATQFFDNDWGVIDKLIEELSGEEEVKAHHTPGSAAAAAMDAADELKEELCEEPGPLKDIIPFLDRVSFRYSLTSLQCSSMLMPNWVYANEFRNMQVVVGSGIDSRTTLNGSFEVGEQMHEVRNHSSGDSQIVLGIALSAVSALGGSVITEEFALFDCVLRFGIFDAQTVSPSMLTRYLAAENERECVRQMSEAIDELQEVLKKRITKIDAKPAPPSPSKPQKTPAASSYPLHFTTQILADRFSFTIPALDSSLCLECDKVSALAYNFVMSEKTKTIEQTALTGAVTPDHVRFLLQNKRLPGGVATLVDLHIRISLYEYIKSGERKRGADIESEFIRICLSSPSLLKLMEILTNIEGDISLLEWETEGPIRPKRKMSRESVDSKVSRESFVSAEEGPDAEAMDESPPAEEDTSSDSSPLQNWRIRTSFEQVTFGWLFPPNSGFNGIVFGCDNVAVVALSGYGQLRLKGVYITPAHGSKDTDFFPDKVFPTHANTVYLPRLLVTFATLDTREYHLRILGEELKGTILPSIVDIVSCTATTIKQTVKELELLSKERNKRLEKSNSSIRVVEPNTAPSDSSLLSIDHSFVFRADAKFQGAVVSLWSESEYAMEMYAETRHIQASSGGRRSTARVVESSPELYLQAPALEAKVDFRHNTGSANKELLKFGVTVEPSSNTLYPRMIPVVLDIVSGMRTLLEDKSDKRKDLKLDLKSEIKKVKIETPQPAAPSKDLTFSEWDITAGIQIERQELIMSCEPTARVSASLSYQNLSMNMTTVDASEEGLGKFFSFTCRLHEFNCSLQHTYSREISAMVGIDEILCVVNKDKDVDPDLANTWNVAVSIVDVIADINVKHTQDLKLFQELWLSEMPEKEKEKEVKVNTDSERFVLKYHRATSGTRICWNATVSNVKFSADLGQSIGKVTVGLDRFWLLTDKKEHLDQHITLGFELIKIHSDGRLGGIVSLSKFRLELALLWEIDEDAQVTPEDVPLVTLVASLASAEIRMAFDYQQFGIASIKNLGFSVSNQREVADYLSAIVDIEQICVFITVLAPSNILDLVQILVRTKQGIEGAYEEEVGASNDETPSKEKKIGRPHLLTSVDVSINSGTLQVYPSTLLDTQVLYVNLSGTHAKFVCDTQKRGLVKSHLELGMHEFIIALSTFKTQINEEDLLTLTVDEFVAHTRRAKGGTIVRIPKVDINMHTWQYDSNPTEVKFTYSSEFAGKVDIGWNFGSVTFIREMWNSHAKAFASRREAYKLNFVSNPSVLKDGELEEKLKDVALDEKYVYVALEPPNIEIPQLRDMGEATPPIEWIGLHRQRFPGLTHQVVIVGLQGLVKEVEVAYFAVLGA